MYCGVLDCLAILYLANLMACIVVFFIGLALVGKGIVFRFIIEYSSFRDFGP